MRIVLDTNVLISAALKGGFSEDILRMAKAQLVTLICSKDILDELYQKLTAKFEWAYTDALYFIDTLKEKVEIVPVKEKLSVVSRDPEDNKILECAVSGKADLIVTADQDLIKLKNFRGIAIIHPKTLAWTFPEYFKKS